jgi:hypothetical protein
MAAVYQRLAPVLKWLVANQTEVGVTSSTSPTDSANAPIDLVLGTCPAGAFADPASPDSRP